MDLLSEVKDRLNVTWEYDDSKINSMIEEGKDFIISRVGRTDFEVEISARKILKEYCLYAWNGSIASFEDDFKSDILNLQLKHGLR
ncbi:MULTISPECIES: phage head-tail connector protein [Peptostreptococcus]|jgi:hypothetical protein|uniref:Phage gp6-like head-tail connector protein n=1 Tax=Peptostreptococcus anaerobius TaxID=1261 RepID=A0A135YZ78_9FIRM|nr:MULTISPECIES: phage gp6-like head-tail connector protein [Peptostreptococcus]KXI14677.1 hypothetical protein HMPREF3195_00132 [Peptostreptococcus anaerobius]MBS5596604.1 phage gp6-like head-tail connector protein [Peptostreptococcus sp.]MDU1264589.1 phage gp6-like head-tail connector protein [Peptostreptococcus sp.]